MPIPRITRRDLLKTGVSAAVVVTLPHSLLVQLGHSPEPVPPIDDPRLKALAMRALEAAKSAGAMYADVRLTHTRTRRVGGGVDDAESMTVGVRALVNGYWGFAASPVWSVDELARLGREAVHQAKANALGKSRVVDLAPTPVVTDGHWVMPVKRDPFEVPIDEIEDLLRGLRYYGNRRPRRIVGGHGRFVVQEKAFGSTEGSYCTQRLYTSSGGVGVTVRDAADEDRKTSGWLDTLTPAGLGWELFRDQPLYAQVDALTEELLEDLTLPVKPVEVGRYDTVFDAQSMAAFLNATLGPATQLDRALGYEANAGGTSYLTAPFEMLGHYQAGASLLTVTANRSEPGTVGTVQWDDEGVNPEPFTLIKDGVLTDFQTMRESAGWMKDYYSKQQLPVRSHGCAAAPNGVEVPLVHTPNLVMVPGREALDFNALVAGVSKGIAIRDFAPNMDWQALNGMGWGKAYEVKQGKRVALIDARAALFRAPEFWKSLLTLGGPGSVRRYGMTSTKGEPAQTCNHSVTAVPAVVKQLTVIDPTRKA